MIEVICEFCKTNFKKDNNHSKRNFCSKICKDSWQKEGLKGNGNPFHGKHHNPETIIILKELKIGTHHTEEWKKQHSEFMKGNQLSKGMKFSPETKEKQRLSKLGSKSHFYGKPPMHGKKSYNYDSPIQGNIKMYHWDYLYAIYLDKNNILWFYEPVSFPLIIFNRQFTYTPDFYLPNENKFVEIKGFWRGMGKEKSDKFRESYPEFEYEVLFKKELKNLGVL